ncbi:MOSC domain-containing protein [Thalassotalea sp. ND16A]|uniref:MOSC domain-containing protein n=1 Tax=Thalassotalea sp. ND16A TaxID=1535422 RepID=UPI00051DCD1D|nr:MOSC N-terminal beta barrel domain-containing protein [Thalassotalea sp. ND16A]KGJ87842.1 hypothetical protein ND16A_2756 [Thalassotalea sp. ND16A]
MSYTQLSSIYSYPIKSTKGLALTSSLVTDTGLEHDRHFVITDLNGKFITGRTKSKLVLVTCSITTDGLMVKAPGMAILHIDRTKLSARYQLISVWNDKILSQHCDDEIDLWFSTYINSPCKVYFLGDKSERKVEGYNKNLSFADGYPLLLLSEASLSWLNHKLPSEINIEQFRPNLVVSNCSAFAEDGWQKIRIGEVEFVISKPCSRCVFTTVNEQTGIRSSDKEPMATLQNFRRADDRQVYFGQNLVALNQGIINIGDKVEVIATQTPALYNLNST